MTRCIPFQRFLFNAYIASVFSKKNIAGTSNKLRDAMEVVASHVDELGKSKIVPLPPQPAPITSQPRVQSKPRRKKGETAYPDWDSKQYKGTEAQRRKDRENRRLIRERKQKENEEELARKVKVLQPLREEGDDEEKAEAPPEPPVPPPAPTKSTKPVETSASKNRRYEMERRKKDKEARDGRNSESGSRTSRPSKGKESG